MPFDDLKFRVVSGLFDIAGNFISGQLTKPNFDEREKILDDYYKDAIEVTRKAPKKFRAPPPTPEPIQEPTSEKQDLTPEKIEKGSACLPCVPPDTMIYANPGVKPIKELETGDMVLDGDGNWTKITKIFNNPYVGLVYDIFIQYQNIPITVTPEHPILTTNGMNIPKYVKPTDLSCGCSYLLFPRISVVKDIDHLNLNEYMDKQYKINDNKIQILSKNNYLSGNKNIYRTQAVGKEINNQIRVTNNLMKLFGFYLAEGSLCNYNRGSGIRFSFGKHEDEYIRFTSETIFNCFGIKPKIVEKRTGINVEIYNYPIAIMFKELFGSTSHSKQIPKIFMYLPFKKQEMLLEGYYKGDGYIRKGRHNNISCTTVSEKLAASLKILLARHGIIPTFSVKTQKDTYIDSRLIKSNGKRYVLDCWGQSAIKLIKIVNKEKLKTNFNVSHGAIIDEKYIYYPIKKIIERQYAGHVMNLETESNSYVANGIIAHNCGRDHFSTVSGALNEALRFARKEGMRHPEVEKRIGIALDELNSLERVDLSAGNIVKLEGKEKDLAVKGLEDSRNLRHRITIMREVGDLEQAAAEASTVRTEFMRNLWGIVTVDGTIDKLCKGLSDEERTRCISTINQVLLEKKETPP